MGRRIRHALLVPLLTALAGCGDDDPVRPIASMPMSAARLDALAASLEAFAHPVLAQVTLGQPLSGLPLDEALGDAAFVLRSAAVTPAIAARGNRYVPEPPEAAANPFGIPDSLRGLTYVADRARPGVWKVDSLPNGNPRTGPVNGVRFVVEGFTATDAFERMGYLDVTQEGTALVVTMRDVDGAVLQTHGGPVAGPTRSGWTSVVGRRIEQTTLIQRTGARVTWESAAIGLSAWRRESSTPAGAHSEDVAIVNAIVVDRTDLRVESLWRIGDVSGFVPTHTVFVDGRPFARFRPILENGLDVWHRVADDRPLDPSERAQVRALLRALRALPDGETAWQAGVASLISLKGLGFQRD